MSHFVPDFETDDDYLIPPSSSSSSRKSTMAEEDIMELLWHNGQVVLQSQTQQRPTVKKFSPSLDLAAGTAPSPRGCAPPPPPPDQNLFIQEDEMASWLHYPLHEDDFCSDLLYPSAASTAAPQPQSISRAASTTVLHPPPPPPPPPPQPQPERPTNQVSASRPPVPPQRRTENEPKSVRNFANFSRFRGDRTTNGGVESGHPSSSSAAVVKAVVRESVLVGSSNTPAAGTDVTRRTDGADTGWAMNGAASSAASGGGASTSIANGVRTKDTTAAAAAASYEISGTSSSKGKAEQVHTPPTTETTEIAGDRKRKGREAVDETECRSEETKQARGSTSTKRSRAAEVHNLSERKRRDRINEKMRILQELIPRCNKSDKASMLDEAIEYMKSLQLQVQMMSMGYGMTPMMYPGMQQYMQHMAMGMGMGMPFPNMLAAPSLPPMAHMGGPAFPAPPFPVPNIHASDPSRVHAQSQQAEQGLNTPHAQHPKQPPPGYLDPYQQFLGLQSIQASMLQNQATAQPSSSKPNSSSKEPKDQENRPTG